MSTINLKTPEEYGYVLKNNLCLFTKGPLSQWWGGFEGQNGGFKISYSDWFNLFDADLHNFYTWCKARFNPLLEWSDTIQFNCTEQWMMACKAALHDDVPTLEKILAEPNPGEQKALGRTVANWNEELYKTHRLRVVEVGNYEKFTQNEELKEWMISNFHPHTIFVEAAPWDKVWGIGLGANDPKAWDINTWEGLNLLGEALQYTRKLIQPDWER